MEKFSSIDQVLDYAINSEQEAVDFYTALSEKTNNPVVKKIFIQNANEEKGHKIKLENIKETGVFDDEFKNAVLDLKISDYIMVKPPSKIEDYADALRLAIHRENGAFKLYSRLASSTTGDLQNTFSKLADEEANHKLKFEIEYDDFVLREN